MVETQTPPDTQSDSAFDSIVKRASGLSAESQQLSTELGESAKLSRGIAQKILDMKPPEAPQIPPPLPPPRGTPQTPPLQAFGSFASALGILGGLLTRRPLETSLKAATAAMNGIHQHDYETAQREFETWKTQSEYASQLSKWQTDRYKMAMDQYKGNQDQLFGALNALAAANKDTVAQHALATGDLRMFENIVMDREQIRNNMDLHRKRTLDWEKENLDIDNRLALTNASKELVEARKTGDPKKIQEAQTHLQDALSANPTYAAATARRQATQDAKKEAATTELTGIVAQIDSIEKLIQEHPSIAGVYGKGKEIYNKTLGQFTGGFQDRREFDAKMKLLQTQLQNKFLNSRYFSRNAIGRMEELVPGLEALEPSQDAITHLENLKEVITHQVKEGIPEVKEGIPETGGDNPYSDMSDDQIKEELRKGIQ